MDRILNSKKDTDSIYEIYRACRLCGGGAGYKMPIIQTIVDLDDSDVELKQKIRDCVQIEVHQDDKMPPLICELCVDKVNDFYEFLDMCRQTNKRTRLRLGLPPQSMPKGAPDAGDCILGVTEPVFVNEDSDAEPLSKHKKVAQVKVKKEPVVKIKIENLEDQERSSRHRKREKTPPRVTRHSKSKEDDISLSSLKKNLPKSPNVTPKSTNVTPKSILKKENNIKTEDPPPLTPRLKRLRDKEPVSDTKKSDPPKKVKISITKPTPPLSSRPKISPKPSPKSSPKPSPRFVPKSLPPRILRSPVVTPPKRPPSPVKEMFPCDICGQNNKTVQGRSNHLRTHTVGYTNPRLACNPCGDWFLTTEDLATHQKRHKTKNIPYTCRRCKIDFKKLEAYEEHIKEDDCIPLYEVPDVKCDSCWRLFATNNLLENHNCLGEDNRPGGKCSKCNRSYALLKNLNKHQSTCTAKKKGEPIVRKESLGKKLRPIQVRVARCDPLLANVKQEHYDVSCVSDEYGLDQNCYYPYISGSSHLRINSKFRGMVAINDEIKKAFCSEDYVHWDSEESDSDDEISCNDTLNPSERKKKVSSLTALALKTIFSKRFLGKVPRKKRKLKPEKVFDSILADEDEVRMDIDSIINNLGDDDADNIDVTYGDKSTKDDDNVSERNGTQINEDNDKDDLVHNCVNGLKSKVDTVSFNNGSPIISSDAISKNNDNDSVKDNTSVDSIDILKDMQNNFDENNDKNVATNDKYTNNLNNDKEDDVSTQVNDSKPQNDSKSVNTTPIDAALDSEINKVDEKSAENKSNNTFNDKHTIESIMSNKTQNNDSDHVTKNDIDDGKSESIVNNKVNDSNDKLSLDDLLSIDNRVGLGSVEDFSFDS